MSLSKKQLKLLQEKTPECLNGIPGIYQSFGKLCCLACDLKSLGKSQTLVNLISNMYSTVSIIAGLQECELEHTMKDYTRETRRAVIAVSKDLLDINGHNKAPLIHRRYYQKETVQLDYFIDGIGLIKDEIRRGIVLEIFVDLVQWPFSIRNFLLEIEEKWMETHKSDKLYQNLDNVIADSCVFISSWNKSVEHDYLTSTGEEVCNFFLLTASSTLVEQLNEISQILETLPSVSLIIIDKLTSNIGRGDFHEIPSVNEWTKMIERVYGSLDDVAIVFTVDKRDYGLTDTKEMVKLINTQVPTAERRRIYCFNFAPFTNDPQLKSDRPSTVNFIQLITATS